MRIDKAIIGLAAMAVAFAGGMALQRGRVEMYRDAAERNLATAERNLATANRAMAACEVAQARAKELKELAFRLRDVAAKAVEQRDFVIENRPAAATGLRVESAATNVLIDLQTTIDSSSGKAVAK